MADLTPEKIIPDEEIERVHAYANFGSTLTKREVVNLGVLKVACEYHQGHTSQRICTEHGLIDKDYHLTAKGRAYLWAVYSGKHPNF